MNPAILGEYFYEFFFWSIDVDKLQIYKLWKCCSIFFIVIDDLVLNISNETFVQDQSQNLRKVLRKNLFKRKF